MGCGLSKDEMALFDANIEVVRDVIHLVQDLNVRQPGGGPTPLLHAVKQGWREHAVVLLKNGAHASLAPAADGITPLHEACHSPLPGLASLMLRRCPNPDIRDAAGRTPLMWAVDEAWGDDRVLACLQAGADPSLHDHEGRTALHNAVVPEHIPLFVSLGCDPMAEDVAGDAPMHVLVGEGDHAPALAELLAAGAHPDTLNAGGRTTLHLCATLDRTHCARLLAVGGAEVDVQDRAGRTPLFLAAAAGHAGVVDALLHAHAEVDATDDHGDTPLHVALRGSHGDIAHSLVVAGADVAAVNTRGRSVRAEAAARGLQHTLAASANPAPRTTLFTTSKRIDVSPAVAAVHASRAALVSAHASSASLGHGGFSPGGPGAAHAKKDTMASLPEAAAASALTSPLASAPAQPRGGRARAGAASPASAAAGSDGGSLAASASDGSLESSSGTGRPPRGAAVSPQRDPSSSSAASGGRAASRPLKTAPPGGEPASGGKGASPRPPAPTLKFAHTPTVKFRSTSGWNLEVPTSVAAAAKAADATRSPGGRGRGSPTHRAPPVVMAVVADDEGGLVPSPGQRLQKQPSGWTLVV